MMEWFSEGMNIPRWELFINLILSALMYAYFTYELFNKCKNNNQSGINSNKYTRCLYGCLHNLLKSQSKKYAGNNPHQEIFKVISNTCTISDDITNEKYYAKNNTNNEAHDPNSSTVAKDDSTKIEPYHHTTQGCFNPDNFPLADE
jgi:hypothetical protein